MRPIRIRLSLSEHSLMRIALQWVILQGFLFMPVLSIAFTKPMYTISVHFDAGAAGLSGTARTDLATVVEWSHSPRICTPDFVIIMGRIARGEAENAASIAVARQRVEAVRRYLVDEQVRAREIYVDVEKVAISLSNEVEVDIQAWMNKGDCR